MSGEKVELADGEELPELPKQPKGAKQVASEAVRSAGNKAAECGPLRKAAFWMYRSTLGLVWRRHLRKQDRGDDGWGGLR